MSGNVSSMTGRSIADSYRRFAENEAKSNSETYFRLASEVAEDAAVLALINQLPEMKRQPNLVFAAARFLGAPLDGYGRFREWLLANWHDVEPVILARATQTNEAARCAVLLPILSRLEGRLALIEVGASAGLCLFPDRYSYRYDVSGATVSLDPLDGPSTVSIPCQISAEAVPSRLPEVVWRAGVDLNPISPTDLDARAWLRALVWPEQTERLTRLDAALDIAASDLPFLVRGDLLQSVSDLVSKAPPGSHVVVFHSSVLVYVEKGDRESFTQIMRSMPNVTWISNEAERVLPRVEEQLAAPAPGQTVLAVNEQPVALVGPHGQSYDALPNPAR